MQVEVAKALNRRFGFDRVELESCTVRLARVMSGIHPKHASFPKIERHGKVDIVCWQAMAPQILIEVKDQITGTDDGLIEDLCRLQDFLKIEHKWNKRKRTAPWLNLPQYGVLVFFVGKNSESYKNDRYLASHFEPNADKTVETVIKKLKKHVSPSFNIDWAKTRVLDSAKDGPGDPRAIGTELEEELSGKEQFTYCIVCVLRRLI